MPTVPDAPPARALAGSCQPRAALAPPDRARMFALMAAHFEGATPERFARDLADKDHVVLLRDGAGTLQGFSTIALGTAAVGGRTVSVAFSGDTIVHPDHWGTPELPRTWIRSVLALADGLPTPLYWLLICGGYKTYRFLPIFFRAYAPRPEGDDPALLAVRDALARARFGDEYDPAAGVVRFRDGGTPLRPGVADLTPGRLRNPHVAFFAAANPGHARGDELVCLTELAPANMTPAGRRCLLD